MICIDCFFFRFSKIQEPLVKRRQNLERVKRIHQFIRDVEDEKLWIDEKMPLATSQRFGNSLLSVQLLKKKNQVSVRNNSEFEFHGCQR